MTLRCRLTGAWCPWPLEPGAIGVSLDEQALVVPEAFPGRFSPLRGFPEVFEPLPLVSGTALLRSGLWRPGSGAVVSGGLVVGIDRLFVEPMLRFAAQVQGRYGHAVSPMTFVESHPSTIPTFLGMLYGLSDYQTTVVRGGISGGLALSHAVDALRTQRLERVLVVGASGDRDGGRLATALCLDTGLSDGPGLEVAIERASAGRDGGETADLLLAIAAWAGRPEPSVLTVSSTDELLDETVGFVLERQGTGAVEGSSLQ